MATLTNWLGRSLMEASLMSLAHVAVASLCVEQALRRRIRPREEPRRSRRFSVKDMLLATTLVALVAGSGHMWRFSQGLAPGALMLALVPGLFAGVAVYIAIRIPAIIDRLAYLLVANFVLANLLESCVAGLGFQAALLWTLAQAVQLFFTLELLLPTVERSRDERRVATA